MSMSLTAGNAEHIYDSNYTQAQPCASNLSRPLLGKQMTATGNQRAPAESSDDQQMVLGDSMFRQKSCTVNPNPANVLPMLPAGIPGHCIRSSAEGAHMLPKKLPPDAQPIASARLQPGAMTSKRGCCTAQQ